MSEEIRPEALKRLEAELAALAPRSDRLDPGWREFLAKQAALAEAMAGDTIAANAACPYCGRGPAGGPRRWLWPAAFSAMTALAATLLAVLVARPAAPIARSGPDDVRPGPAPTAVSGDQGAKVDRPERPEPPSQHSATSPAPEPTGETPFASMGSRWQDRRLRNFAETESKLADELLAMGLKRPPPTLEAALAETAAAGFSYRELLDDMLRERATR